MKVLVSHCGVESLMGSAMVLSVNITSPCWSTRTTELVLKYTQQKHVAINVHTTTNHKEERIIPASLSPCAVLVEGGDKDTVPNFHHLL